MDVIIGIGTTGIWSVKYFIEWAANLGFNRRIEVIGIDTNEAEIRGVESQIENLANKPQVIKYEFKPIGKKIVDNGGQIKIADEALPKSISGGVVSTQTGAGNRRLLGLASYLQPSREANIWSEANVEQEVRSAFAAGGADVAVAIGSLIGGTASGTLPKIGSMFYDFANSFNVINRVAIGIVPRAAHESAVRKANAIAALRDLNIQQRKGIWTHVFILSPGYHTPAGRKGWIAGETEKESLEALLWIIGLLLYGIASDPSQIAAAAPGTYALGLSGKYNAFNEILDAGARRQVFEAMVSSIQDSPPRRPEEKEKNMIIDALDSYSVVGKDAFVDEINWNQEAENLLSKVWNSWDGKYARKLNHKGLFGYIDKLINGWIENIKKQDTIWFDRIDWETAKIHLYSNYEPQTFWKKLAMKTVTVQNWKEIFGDSWWNLVKHRIGIHSYEKLRFKHLDIELFQARLNKLVKTSNKFPDFLSFNFNSDVRIEVPPIKEWEKIINTIKGTEINLAKEILSVIGNRFNPGSECDSCFHPDEKIAMPALEGWLNSLVHERSIRLRSMNIMPPISMENIDIDHPVSTVEMKDNDLVSTPSFPFVFGDGANWQLQVWGFKFELDKWDLWHDKKTKRELRELNTYNATRYPYELKKLRNAVPFDVTEVLDLIWKNIGVWENDRLMRVKATVIGNIIDPKPYFDDNGAVFLKIVGLPGFKLFISPDRETRKTVSVPETFPFGIVWIWGIEHILDTIRNDREIDEKTKKKIISYFV